MFEIIRDNENGNNIVENKIFLTNEDYYQLRKIESDNTGVELEKKIIKFFKNIKLKKAADISKMIDAGTTPTN